MPAGARCSIWIALAACLMLLVPPAHGQGAPRRLSDWLLEQPRTADDYPLGLSWRVPEEVPAQYALKLELIAALAALERDRAVDPESAARLGDWIRTLPVTGRVPVSVADPRWLQGNPARDPILLGGHSVVLPRRPVTVTVITARGERCTVAHSQGREARAYLDACDPTGVHTIDWAWIAQPDARLQRYGVATWNREPQDEPAPGAWIWGAPRQGGWPERVSRMLIEFLATQGPAAGDDGPSAAGRQLPALGEASAVQSERSRGLQLTPSDWGTIGLLQTPTARMAEAGNFAFALSRTFPYTHGNVFAQPLDGVEAGFRYTSTSNRLYSQSPEFSGDQPHKDKSVDVKFRLWRESAYLPEMAIGLRDVSGTGLFAGEYLVANKRTGAFDWSLGLGWGYVGARGDIRNPLSVISRKFDNRTKVVGFGGSFLVGSFFRGPTALFGGVQYQTPWERLILKLEYDGNDYQDEPQQNNQRQTSPVNAGLVYRLSNWVDLSFGVERGNTVMVGLALHSPLNRLYTPKLNDPPRVPVAALRPQREPAWSDTVREIERQTDWQVRSIEQGVRELRVTIADSGAIYRRERLDRMVAVLHRDAPASIDRFAFVHQVDSVEVAEYFVDREAWVAERTRPLPPRERRESVFAGASGLQIPSRSVYRRAAERFEYGFGPTYQHVMGGPDGFIMYQIGLGSAAKLRVREDTWLQGAVQFGLVSNFDKYKNRGSSSLPRVRTFLREYFVTSRFTMPNLQLTHVGKLGGNHYYSLYGGYLEFMFAGVGGEWLYRPSGSSVALGVDLNAVRQRGFAQDFELRDYRTGTGHATLYWDTGWQDVLATVSFGRYLAGDVGATFQLSRTFDNGMTIGAFFTKTDVSSVLFGEGSFDKGLFINVPFDVFLTKSSPASANVLWRPLTRDGGAKLLRTAALYDMTSARNNRSLQFASAPPPNKELIPADRRERWTPGPEEPAPYTRIVAKPPVEQWQADARYEQRLFEALYAQAFRDIVIAFEPSRRLTVHLSNERIRPASRAVGRAARTALSLTPLETRELRIVFLEHGGPAVAYDFLDLARLSRYFSGTLNLAEMADSIAVEYVNPSARVKEPLAQLDDLEIKSDERSLTEVLAPDARVVSRVGRDFAGAAQIATRADWLRAGALGAGLVIAASYADRRADRFALEHADSGWSKAATRFGDALPWLAAGGAALAAFDAGDPVRSRTGYAAVEAGATAYLAATGLKYAVGRARPGAGADHRSFKIFSSTAGHDAFPSRHASVAWAVLTPFAIEYNAPWLYGIAAITNLGRVSSREHWLSDTVAGSLVGYGIGRIFLETARASQRGGPRVLLKPSGVDLAWQFD